INFSSVLLPSRRNEKMKLSNYLDTALTDPQYHFYQGSGNSGPPRVAAKFSEVFSFSGEHLCEFLSDVPTDQSLFRALNSMPPATDVWMTKPYLKTPLELFVSHGNFLARGKKRLIDGKSFEFNQSTNKDGSISRPAGKLSTFACNVVIENCLNVPLRNRNKFYSNSSDKDFWPLEIQSFHRETFLGSSDTKFEAMFSYEILSSDLALVIALKVGPGTNSFAAAFSQIPAVSGKNELEVLMNSNDWKVHGYKKCSNAINTLESLDTVNQSEATVCEGPLKTTTLGRF
ncbi:unnamed protein product, partial [Allacma fusca]